MSRAKIAAANDAFRSSLSGGTVLLSRDVYDLDAQLKGRLLWRVTQYNSFDKDGYHDAGLIIFADFVIHWRIEQRDKPTLIIEMAEDLQR